MSFQFFKEYSLFNIKLTKQHHALGKTIRSIREPISGFGSHTLTTAGKDLVSLRNGLSILSGKQSKINNTVLGLKITIRKLVNKHVLINRTEKCILITGNIISISLKPEIDEFKNIVSRTIYNNFLKKDTFPIVFSVTPILKMSIVVKPKHQSENLIIKQRI